LQTHQGGQEWGGNTSSTLSYETYWVKVANGYNGNVTISDGSTNEKFAVILKYDKANTISYAGSNTTNFSSGSGQLQYGKYLIGVRIYNFAENRSVDTSNSESGVVIQNQTQSTWRFVGFHNSFNITKQYSWNVTGGNINYSQVYYRVMN